MFTFACPIQDQIDELQAKIIYLQEQIKILMEKEREAQPKIEPVEPIQPIQVQQPVQTLQQSTPPTIEPVVPFTPTLPIRIYKHRAIKGYNKNMFILPMATP